MLQAEGLCHSFGATRALDDVSLSLNPGQTLAVFGPNGAGKTTLLKALAGLIRPERGTVRLPPGGRSAVGWIGHQSHLYGHLTIRENLLFWASLYDVPAQQRAARVETVMDRLGVVERGDEAVRTLSRGLTQRAAIARALVHDPPVLLLDEPFTGLDLAGAADLGRLLAELAQGGRIMVLVTHNVGEGAELATHVAFQRSGRFVAQGPRGSRGAGEIAEAYRQAVASA